MKKYILEASLPIVLLGVPLSDSENPFLAVPLSRVKIAVAIDHCKEQKHIININNKDIGYLLSGFITNLEEITRNLCLQIEIINNLDMSSKLSVYSLLTSIIVHALAKYYSETLDAWEILETARYADPMDKPSGWTYVLDAARYATLTGSSVIFRNDEEFAKLEYPSTGKLIYRSTINALSQKLTRENIGDVYNSLVHTVGVMVLEAAVKLREKEDIIVIIETLGRLQNGLIASIWEIDYPPANCILVPGLPGEFDIYCW